MVVIIDYDSGNIASVLNMIRRAGHAARVSSRADDIAKASALILPGVGSFDHGVRQLRARGLPDLIRERAAEGIPILGICLGMQLLALDSEEGELEGLGLIRAHIKRFSFPASCSLPVPHVGWNKVVARKDNPLIPSDGQERRFYFVHSYYAQCELDDDVLYETEYGIRFASGFSNGDVYGMQFHPEKSHRFGLDHFRRLLGLANA
jgi:glutamine amidotransferase